MTLPAIVSIIRSGAPLTPLQAVAGKLWLGTGGEAHDRDGRIAAAISAYWKTHGGEDAYWSYLETRSNCATCGETFRLENLSVCPNCFKTYCYKEARHCTCGHTTIG